ncbi:pilus assembly protein, probably tadA [Bifidobacterium actinocoloniiforme DSM 22766]|uniref:Pilus assembly protein, probably tadA n=1 Tax=Bifidobacterium actinocoloniiforme DSM 22766 TaxID=1437605 RepID=A0A086Z2C1_9BIFI|nr:pilus assembly protein, probably tadA [Bifidobacterium actinocoloniiforme DSM 22766]
MRPGFTGPAMVREYAVQLCSQLGKRLDDSCPIADASTEGGVRVHAVIPPLVASGASISIRLPDRARPGLEGLAAGGLCPAGWVRVLKALVAGRATLMITGGTGSGKTTLLKALLGQCGSDERIVSVEEVRELGALQGHGDHVSMAVREANVEGAGAVGLPELIKATLRMRPDRIVLGECRGEEVADLLRAFNSGHHGGMVTLHADSVGRVPARLATLGLLAGLDPLALAALVEGAFDAVIHLERVGSHRRIAQIGLLGLDGRGRLRGRPVCVWDGGGPALYSPLWPGFARRWGIEGVGPTGQCPGNPATLRQVTKVPNGVGLPGLEKAAGPAHSAEAQEMVRSSAPPPAGPSSGPARGMARPRPHPPAQTSPIRMQVGRAR